MEAARFREMQIELARSTLRARDEVSRYLDESIKAGKKREANSWRARLREIEKQIATYGLDRYAPRP